MSASDRGAPCCPDRSMIRELLLFRVIPIAERELLSACFDHVVASFGETIVREGDPADALYVVSQGAARAISTGSSGEEVPLARLGPHDTFGEIAVLDEGVRSATVRASSELHLFRLEGSVLRSLLAHHPDLRDNLTLHSRAVILRGFLRRYSAFARLPDDALQRLLRALEPQRVAAGSAVISEGDPPGPLYVVESGRLRVVGRNGEVVRYLYKGDFFGEVSLIRGTPRTMTVEAVEEAELLVLGVDDFTRMLSDEPEFRRRIEEQIETYDYKRIAVVPAGFGNEPLPAELGFDPLAAAAPATLDEGGAGTTEAAGAATPRRRRGRRGRRRFPHVWQVDEADCGAACLAIVCRHFGAEIRLSTVRDLARTRIDGTSLLGIATAAESLGMTARRIKASASRLDDLALPAIVHLDGNHWVVLYDVNGDTIRYSDPALGRRKVSREEFTKRWTGFTALVEATEAFPTVHDPARDSSWIVDLFRPYRKVFVAAFFLAVLAAGLEMMIPVFSQLIVDRVVDNGNHHALTAIVAAMFGVLVVATAATVVQRVLLARVAVRMDGASLEVVTGRMLDLPMSYFLSRRTGDIARRLGGIRQVRQFAVQSGVLGLAAATQLIVATAVMFVYSWQVGVVYLCLIPAYAGLMRFSALKLRPVFEAMEESMSKYQSQQLDAIRGIETVKVMGAEHALRRVLGQQFKDLATKLYRSDLTVMVYEGAVQLVAFLSLALVLTVGAIEVIQGHLTVGGLVSVSALAVLASGPVALLLGIWDQLQYSSLLLDRMADIVDREPEQGPEVAGHDRGHPLSGRIRFERVSFDYGGARSRPVLVDISLDVPPGRTVAIVGRSGSGKTTLAKCLAGLLEPTSGRILYDEVDMLQLDRRLLRKQIGFVLQENHLFADTIARNIAFGDETADLDRVMWAARLAAAHDFIMRLPLGYDTQVGETGLLLSGGQRQRVSLARAVYSRPPVLVLDEATSSLDSEAERMVQENLESLLQGRTSFIIAHRLSTVRDADMIVVIDQGRIVERGTHEELMERRGLYFYLVSQQLDL